MKISKNTTLIDRITIRKVDNFVFFSTIGGVITASSSGESDGVGVAVPSGIGEFEGGFDVVSIGGAGDLFLFNSFI